MCSSNVGIRKKVQILSDFRPCRSRQSLAIAQVSRLDLSSAKATFKRNNLSQARGKMLVSIIKSQNGAASVCLEKEKKNKDRKKREKSASPLGVIFEAGSVHRLVGYVSPLSVRQIFKSRSQPNKHTIYRTDTGIKLLFILLFFFFVLFCRLIKFFFFKKQCRGVDKLPRRRSGGTPADRPVSDFVNPYLF